MFIKHISIVSLLIIAICGVSSCAMFGDNGGSLEKPGMIEKAPPGKYRNESGTVWEEPEFFDNENGTAAEVPI